MHPSVFSSKLKSDYDKTALFKTHPSFCLFYNWHDSRVDEPHIISFLCFKKMINFYQTQVQLLPQAKNSV